MSFRLFFAGGDHPVSRQQLTTWGVHRFGLSFHEFRAQHQDNDLSFLPEGAEVLLTSGVSKKKSLDWELFCQDYVDFALEHAESLAYIFDIDATACPPELRLMVREQLGVLDTFVVFPMPHEPVTELVGNYPLLGINAGHVELLKDPALRKVKVVGSNVQNPAVLTTHHFEATLSYSWLSARRFGELWVWTGRSLQHYSATGMTRALRLHHRLLADVMSDMEALERGERDALVESALRSFLGLEAHLNGRKRDRSAQIAAISSESPPEGALRLVAPAPDITDLRAPESTLSALHPSRTVVTSQGAVALDVSTGSVAQLRMCDSCYLAPMCPMYLEESPCRLSLHTDISTPGERERASRALLELQYERVRFAALGEQFDGGALQAGTGKEMDRFFAILHTLSDIHSTESASPESLLTNLFPLPPGKAQDATKESGPKESGQDIIEAEEVPEGPAGTDVE